MLKPGGLFLFTCATTGKPEHGTRRTTPMDAPLIQGFDDWSDYYKNLTEEDIRDFLDVDGLFSSYAFSVGHETHDLYFWGILNGERLTRTNYSFQIARPTLRDILALKNEIARLSQALSDRDSQIARLSEALSDRDGQLEQIISSRSWRFTTPVRFLGRLARGEFRVVMASLQRHSKISALRPILRQARNALGSVASRGFKNLRNRSLAPKGDLAVGHAENTMIAPCGKTWVIMTTQYTLFIAHLFEVRLKAHGWDVKIVTEAPTSFDHDWYVVLCPQMFKLLPPAEKRIIYQLEQSVSSGWFTAEYINILKDSFAVLDYALVNIDFLKQRSVIYPHVHYLPIGSSEDYGSKAIVINKAFDVLFYGGITAGRQRMLSALQEHFDVCIVSDVFGEKMQELIKSARIVINLHFYENALLETTRIQECLSLGVPVVSESAQDQDDYPEIGGGVIYFKEGSIEEMLIAVQYALDNQISLESIRSSVKLGASRFALMFDRFLITMGLLQTSIARENESRNCQ